MSDYIEIKNARVNNLKNISLKIPRNKFIVISGVSGSGKSSLAFDTLYAEGQRRYVESLSSYARQFLGRMNKPECDLIYGLPPAIAIEQKVISRNSRSTVGTSTEIYEYLKLLYARIGHTFSPVSGQEVKRHTVDDIFNFVFSYTKGTRFIITSPIDVCTGQSVVSRLELYIKQGYSRLFVKNDIVRIDDYINKYGEHAINEPLFLIVDRIAINDDKDTQSRIYDSITTALFEGDGKTRLVFLPSNLVYDFSTTFEADGIKFEVPTENMFSFNSPMGACERCEGTGKVLDIDERLVIPNSTLSVYDGCVQCWHGEKMGEWKNEFCRRAAKDNFPIFEPYYQLSFKHKDWLWHGLPCDKNKDIDNKVCIDSFFKMVKDNLYKIQYRVMMSRYRGKTTCPDCHGTRLKKQTDNVKIQGLTISNLVEMPIVNLKEWFDKLQLEENEQKIAKRLLLEINNRIKYLVDVGLGYLTLNRPSNSLSGGESQRISLTRSLGSCLIGSLYILDEPSIGLHSRDTDNLIHVLKDLQSMGNTVVVVEHDEEIIRQADHLIDIGPDAGTNGGNVVYEGSLKGLTHQTVMNNPQSYTLKYLNGELSIPVPTTHRSWNQRILLNGVRMNNLRGIDATIPLNVLTVVTGVSGSGKSSLIKGVLYPALKRHLDEVADLPGEYLSLEGDWQSVRHVEIVDQNPIGKSSRSNPVTYLKAYDLIRQLYANQPLAIQLGLTPKHFSFNAEGGRCEECKGTGSVTIEMQFMADIELECEACHGKRFKKEVLEVMFNGQNINDILNMTVSQAIDFFNVNGQKNIASTLKPLEDVGLGYVKLGQSSSTLSGGESQRVKLAYYLSLEKTEHTLFIFDEPTTGLHFHDIAKLLSAFNALIGRGHTVLVIEHNMDVVKCADYIIDLGPGGGDKGGRLVCQGTPREVAACNDSITGYYLKAVLAKEG